jgi:hypothetical protein
MYMPLYLEGQEYAVWCPAVVFLKESVIAEFTLNIWCSLQFVTSVDTTKNCRAPFRKLKLLHNINK